MQGNLHVRFGVGVGVKSPGLHHSQNDLSGIQAVQKAQLGGTGVPKLIRAPGVNFRQSARSFNRPAVASRCVMVTRLPLRFGSAVGSRAISLVQRSFPCCVALCSPDLFGFSRRKAASPWLALEPGLQDRLRAGAQIDPPFQTVMLGLVCRRPVTPDVTRPFDVGGTHCTNLARSTAGEPLQTDHRLDRCRQEGERCLDRGVCHRKHRGRFTSRTPPFSQARHSGQGLVRGHWS